MWSCCIKYTTSSSLTYWQLQLITLILLFHISLQRRFYLILLTLFSSLRNLLLYPLTHLSITHNINHLLHRIHFYVLIAIVFFIPYLNLHQVLFLFSSIHSLFSPLFIPLLSNRSIILQPSLVAMTILEFAILAAFAIWIQSFNSSTCVHCFAMQFFQLIVISTTLSIKHKNSFPISHYQIAVMSFPLTLSTLSVILISTLSKTQMNSWYVSLISLTPHYRRQFTNMLSMISTKEKSHQR